MQTTPASLRAPITDVPVFHWFFVSIVAFCLYMSLGDAWWMSTILGLILLRLLTWSMTLYAVSEIEVHTRRIKLWKLTLLGVRASEISFDEIAEVRVSTKTWGDHNSRQVRGTLLVCRLNDAEDIVHSSRDLEHLEELAGALRQVIALPERQLRLADAAPQTAETLEALRARCATFVNGKRFMGPDQVDDALRATLEEKLGLPSSEDLWCFVDTSLLFKGHFGLVVAERGLYWANDAELWEHTRRTNMSWQELAEVDLAKDPIDEDVLVGTTSQIGLGVLQQSEEVLTFLQSLQQIVRGGHTAQ